MTPPTESLDGIAENAFPVNAERTSILNGNGISDGYLPQTSSLEVYFHFSAGSGSTLSNEGSGGDGSIVGATWVSGYEGEGGLSFDASDDEVNFDTTRSNDAFTYVLVSAYDQYESSRDTRYAIGDGDGKFIEVGSNNGVPAGIVYDGNAQQTFFDSAPPTGTYFFSRVPWRLRDSKPVRRTDESRHDRVW